jgi:hypothetical protein
MLDVQVAVDIATPREVFDAVKHDIDHHFRANPTEYTGNSLVVANFAGDPLKITLCVWWEYTHPGEHTDLSVCLSIRLREGGCGHAREERAEISMSARLSACLSSCQSIASAALPALPL